MTGPKRDWSAPMFTAEQLAAEAQKQRRGRRRIRTGAAAAAAVVAVVGGGVWAGEQVGQSTTPPAGTITAAPTPTPSPVTRVVTSVSLVPPIVVRATPSTVRVTVTNPAISVTVTVTAKVPPTAHVAAPTALGPTKASR